MVAHLGELDPVERARGRGNDGEGGASGGGGGVSGVPTFVANGKGVVGAQEYGVLAQLVEAAGGVVAR